MKNKKLVTSQLREMLTYVARFSRLTFVIALDGRMLENCDMLPIAGDICLLHEVGIRIVLVLGSSDQTDYKLRRKTKGARLCSLADKLCQSINTIHCRFITPMGTGDAKSQDFALQMDGNAESIPSKVRDIMDKDTVPVVVATPTEKNPDESWFQSLLRVTTRLCRAILIDKLIYLSCVDGIFLKDKTLLREAHPDEIRKLIEEEVITGQFAEFASMAEQVIDDGVVRVHCINGKVNGGLINEVFTKDGIGTMIYRNSYQEIRPARASDVSGILNMLDTQGSNSSGRRHTAETIEAQLANYRVAVKDDDVIACGCLRCFPNEHKAMVSSFAVDQSYLSHGIGTLMLKNLTEEAKGQGVELLALVSPHTGVWWFSRDFETGTVSDLPAELQAGISSPSTIILVQRFPR